MISYGQNAEDVVLSRALPGTTGFYVDVGAASPDASSVTRHFYDLGWRGINIDPRAAAFAELCERRPRDINLMVAAGAEDGVATFHIVREDPDLSTIDADDLAFLEESGYEYTTETVEVRTLSSIFTEYEVTAVDFLKVDAEGAEGEVLAGIDLERWRPRVIVVEAIRPWSRQRVDSRWRHLLEFRGYVEGLFDGVNLFFAQRADDEVLENLLPASALDEFVTAEVMALRAELDWHRARSPTPGAGGTDREAPTEDAPPRLSRLAVIGTPCSGNGWIRAALAEALAAEELIADHPADIAWSVLPPRFVIEMSWRRSRQLEEVLQRTGTRVLSPARHPYEVLDRLFESEQSSYKRCWDSAPTVTEPDFLNWAVSAETRNRVEITADWWSTPSTIKVRYEDLVADPEGQLFAMLRSANVAISGRAPLRPSDVAATAQVTEHVRTLSESERQQLQRAYEAVLAQLGYSAEEA